MAFYIRKIARAKWNQMGLSIPNNICNCRADTIANDLRTSGDTLSLWMAESLDDQHLNPIIAINCLLGDKLQKIDIICIPEEDLENYEIVQENGTTVVRDYANHHYNLMNLTVNKLLQFGQDIVISTLSEENKKEYCKLIKVPKQLQLICEMIQQNKIMFKDLKDTQKKDIEKYYVEHYGSLPNI